ncbi:MAG: hypothetical protein ABEJ79_04865 [Halolamina sp.]
MSPSARDSPVERIADSAVWQRGQPRLARSVRAAGFWLSVLLPVSYLTLLWNGLSAAELTTFGGLLALNVVALVVGHDYGDDRFDR